MTEAPLDLSALAVSVEHRFEAPADLVWDVVTDLPRMAGFSPEVQELAWDQADRSTFTATNSRGGRTWTVTGHVIERDPPHLLRWTVSDPSHPSSTWSYALTPVGEGATVVRHDFVHGPGSSLVRQMVERDRTSEASVVAWRQGVLREDMSASLRAAADALASAR